jgi:hypothetical protein
MKIGGTDLYEGTVLISARRYRKLDESLVKVAPNQIEIRTLYLQNRQPSHQFPL